MIKTKYYFCVAFFKLCLIYTKQLMTKNDVSWSCNLSGTKMYLSGVSDINIFSFLSIRLTYIFCLCKQYNISDIVYLNVYISWYTMRLYVVNNQLLLENYVSGRHNLYPVYSALLVIFNNIIQWRFI